MRKPLLAVILALLMSQLISQAVTAPPPGYKLGDPIDGLRPLPFHFDRKSTEELLKILGDEDAVFRASAARELGKRKATEALEPIKKLLTDKSVVVQTDAAIALLDLGDMSAMPVLRDMLKGVSLLNRLEAAEALARYGDDSGLYIARQELTNENSAIRERAVKALAASKNDAVAYAALEAGIKDPETHVRGTAVYLLEKRPGKRGVELLGDVLTSESDTFTRSQAVVALSRQNPRDAIPLLLQALSDTDKTVGRTSVEMLNRVTGQSVSTRGMSRDETWEKIKAHWREWWEANKDKPLPGEKK